LAEKDMIERRLFDTSLPKAVVDRISRYAREGRQLRAVFGPEGCRLLAVAGGAIPAVVLRAETPDQFARLRTAALLEWKRATAASRGRPSAR
jgi:hypothetical protein